MSNDAQVDREDEDGARERELEARSAGSRRALLGAGAGSFALAASGLLLPGWLAEEAAARPGGALDGRLGGRHGNNRRGRNEQRRRRLERRREQDRRQRDKDATGDKPRGGVFDSPGIEFRVELTGGRPVKVDFYVSKNGWNFTDRDTLSTPAPLQFFLTDESSAALWIDDRYIVRAHSILGATVPDVDLGHGGAFIGGQSWRGGTLVSSSVLQEGAESRVMQVDGYAILARRLGDSSTRYVYKVTIAAPAP